MFSIHVFIFFSESKIIQDKSATISSATPPPQKVCNGIIKTLKKGAKDFNDFTYIFFYD